MENKKMVLYETVESNEGCLTFLVGLIILIIMLIVDSEYMDYSNEGQLISLTILLPVTGAIFTLISISIYQFYKNKPRELLSISEAGLHYHLKDSQITWEEISEIQIIDSVLSVTVDSEPEKDFKLALHTTDFYKRQMSIDAFAKFINFFYQKNIYTYTSPPSCGCC